MSGPLCMIGDAVFERIGLNPRDFKYHSQAILAAHQVFDDEPFYQPTAMGERSLTLELATRPHIFGGLRNWDTLRAHHEGLEVVPYMRLYGLETGGGFPIGQLAGDVFVRDITHAEGKLAPDGLGYLSALLKAGAIATEADLDAHVSSHAIAPPLLRADGFDAFYAARRERLLGLIQECMGQSVYRGVASDEATGPVIDGEDDNREPFPQAAE